MSSAVNEALRVYLGADEKGGFSPSGCEERLANAYPADHVLKKKLIGRYLDEPHTPDWPKHDLVREGDVFADLLKKKFPDLEDTVIRSLANRFTFDWR
jgi:hypothetical protein